MKTVVLSPDELTELVDKAVADAVKKYIPGAVRQGIKKPYLTTAELCAMTGWSRRSVQHLRDSRQLPFIQTGRLILFDTDEVEIFLSSKRFEAKTRGKS
jgi:excisionase family DNA binding protein